jgi:oligosaccharide repeat unit polymerase
MTTSLTLHKSGFHLYVLLFLIVLIAFLNLFPNRVNYEYPLLILGIAISALFLMLLDNLFDTRSRPVHLLFCIYMIFSYLLPGYFHTASGHFPWFEAGYSPSKVLSGAIVVLVFLMCTIITYSVDFAPRGASSRGIIPIRLTITILFWAVAALIAGVMFGIGSIRAPRGDDADELVAPGSLIIASLAHYGSFYAFAFALVALKCRHKLIDIMIMIFTMSIFLVMNSPLAIPRSTILSYVILILCMFISFSRTQKLVLVLILVASQLTVFSYLHYLQNGAQTKDYHFSPVDEYTTNGDFDGFQSTINVVAMYDGMGGKGGVNLLSAMFTFVPRDLWPAKLIGEKSRGTGVEAGIYQGYPFFNLSSPLPSEFYVDFGMPGVVALSLLFGFLLRFCDDYFTHFKKTSDLIGQILVGTVAAWIFVIMRGSLAATSGPIILCLAIAGFSHRYCTAPVRRPTIEDPPAQDHL